MNEKQREVIEEALSYLSDMVSAGAEDDRTMRLIRDLNEVLFPSLHDARLIRERKSAIMDSLQEGPTMMTRKELATYAYARVMECRDKLQVLTTVVPPKSGHARANPVEMLDIGKLRGMMSAYADMAFYAVGVPYTERDELELPGLIQGMKG